MADNEQGSHSTTLIVVVAIIAIAAFSAITFFVARSVAGGGDPQATPQADPSQQQMSPEDEKALKESLLGLQKRDPKDKRALGDVDAPVVMIQYSDYSCPMCAKFTLETLPELQKYIDDGTLRIEYHDLPIFDDQYNSSVGALGGFAAAQQDKFWQFNTAAAQLSAGGDHPVWDEDLAIQVAQQAGVPDIDKFKKDMANQKYARELQQEETEARQMGIAGTPFFYINQYQVNGAQPTDYFKEVIEGVADEVAAEKK